MKAPRTTRSSLYLLIAFAALCLGLVITAMAAGVPVSSTRLTVVTSTTSVPCVEQVTMSNFAFTPSTVTISAGCSVTWTNAVTTKHTSTRTATPEPWDSELLSQNQTFTRVFSSAGTFSYVCRIHPSMTGTIVVN
jgi:plastocyanin